MAEKQKRTPFNALKARIENGWERLGNSGFNFKEFRAPAIFFTAFAAIATALLVWFKGLFEMSFWPLLTTVEGLVYGTIALLLFSEAIFYFLFVFGRIKKMSFWKETFVYKIVSYILGIVAIIVTPLVLMIETFLIIFVINYVVMNNLIRSNYDRYEEYHNPKRKYKDEDDEEDKPLPKGVQATMSTSNNQPMLLAQPPQAQLTAFGQPVCKMETISADEMKQMYDMGIININSDINIDLKNIGKFLKNVNW